MSTDDERREVAAELRELAEYYEKVPALSVIAACDLPVPIDDAFMACGLGRAFHATEICGRLADLIEPDERTCRVIMKWDGLDGRDPVCSECGTYFCDEKWRRLDYKFCPNCGARVVDLT